MDKAAFDVLVDTRDHLRTIQVSLEAYSSSAKESHDLITRINNVLKADNRPHCLESGEHKEYNVSGYCVDCGETYRG